MVYGNAVFIREEAKLLTDIHFQRETSIKRTTPLAAMNNLLT